MKGLNLLLASAERRLSNPIEVAVRDVCFEQALITCTRVGRVDEFFRLGCADGFDLIIVAPENLLPVPSQRAACGPVAESLNVIRRIKSQHLTPIIAVAVSASCQQRLFEAGADSVLGTPFNGDALKAEVRRLLSLREAVVQTAPCRRSLGEALLRGWQRLTQAKT